MSVNHCGADVAVSQLQLQQSLRRIDDHSTCGEIDLLNHPSHRRDQVLLRFALDYVEIAARLRPDTRDGSDTCALGVEDFEADDLIVVILVRMYPWEK